MTGTTGQGIWQELLNSPMQNLDFLIPPIESFNHELESLVKGSPQRVGKFHKQVKTLKIKGPDSITSGGSSSTSDWGESPSASPRSKSSPTSEELMEQYRRTEKLLELDEQLKMEEAKKMEAISASIKWYDESPNKISGSIFDRWVYANVNLPDLLENMNIESQVKLQQFGKQENSWREYEMWSPKPFEYSTIKYNHPDVFHDVQKVERVIRYAPVMNSYLMRPSFMNRVNIGVIGDGRQKPEIPFDNNNYIF